ncbi:hypothetical protein PSNTI_27010 [Stutzerimonas stutzeri]|nr:hypothetical protein PSNTI_27010 [Stutzerimonas stutzeri]
MQPLRGVREMQLVSQDDKVAKMSQFHVPSPFCRLGGLLL